MAGNPLSNPLSSSQPANPLGNPLAGPTTLDNDPRVTGMETTGAARFDTNTFGRALARGSDQVKGSIGEFANLLGTLSGSEGLTSYGAKLIDNAATEAALNPPEIQDMDDLDSFEDFGTFAIEALGSQVPQLASMAVTGGIAGGGAKLLAKTFGKKLARNAAGLNMAAETAKKAGAFTRGFKVGAFADLYAQSVGEVAAELRDNGINPNATALVGGAAIAALDFASLGAIYKTFGLAKDFKTANGLVSNVMRGMSKGAVTEAPTEALQEAIVVATALYNDPDAKLSDIVSEENLKRYGFAGLAGGVVGGTLGGAGGVSNYVGEVNAAAEQKRPLFGGVSEGDLLAAARVEPGDASFTVDAEGNVTGQAAAQEYGPVERQALAGPSEDDLIAAARVDEAEPAQDQVDFDTLVEAARVPSQDQGQSFDMTLSEQEEVQALQARLQELEAGIGELDGTEAGRASPERQAMANEATRIQQQLTGMRGGRTSGFMQPVQDFPLNKDRNPQEPLAQTPERRRAEELRDRVDHLTNLVRQAVSQEPDVDEVRARHVALDLFEGLREADAADANRAQGRDPNKPMTMRQLLPNASRGTLMLAHQLRDLAAQDGAVDQDLMNQLRESYEADLAANPLPKQTHTPGGRALTAAEQKELRENPSVAAPEDQPDTVTLHFDSGVRQRYGGDLTAAIDPEKTDPLVALKDPEATGRKLSLWTNKKEAQKALTKLKRERKSGIGQSEFVVEPARDHGIEEKGYVIAERSPSFDIDARNERDFRLFLGQAIRRAQSGLRTRKELTEKERRGDRLTEAEKAEIKRIADLSITITLPGGKQVSIFSTDVTRLGGMIDPDGSVKLDGSKAPERMYAQLAARNFTAGYAELVRRNFIVPSSRDGKTLRLGADTIFFDPKGEGRVPMRVADIASIYDAQVSITNEINFFEALALSIDQERQNPGTWNLSVNETLRTAREAWAALREEAAPDGTTVQRFKQLDSSLYRIARWVEAAYSQPVTEIKRFQSGRRRQIQRDPKAAEIFDRLDKMRAKLKGWAEDLGVEYSAEVDPSEFESTMTGVSEAEAQIPNRRLDAEVQDDKRQAGLPDEAMEPRTRESRPTADEPRIRATTFGRVHESIFGFANALMNEVGLTRPAVFIQDQERLDQLAENYPQAKAWIESVQRDGPRARIFVPPDGPAFIYINESQPVPVQLRAVGHELGHLLQVDVLDKLDPMYKEALMAKLGRDPKEFAENFADQLHYWAHRRGTEPNNFISRFFKNLAERLRNLWRRARMIDQKAVDPVFDRFIAAVVGARAQREGKPFQADSDWQKKLIEHLNQRLDPNNPNLSREAQVFDMTLDPNEAGDRVSNLRAGTAAKLKQLFRGMRDDGPSMFGKASNLWKVLDSQLRNMDSRVATHIADHFRRVPGQTNSTVEGATVGEDIQRVRAKLEVKSRALMNRHRERLGMPQANPWTLLRESVGLGKPAALPAKYKAYQQALKYQTPLDQIEDAEVREMVSEVREYYKEALLEFNRHLRKAGKTIKARKNYSPIWFHMASIEKDAEGFKAKLAEAFNLQPGSNAVEDLYNKIVHASGAFDPEATSPEQQEQEQEQAERQEDPDVVGFASADPRNITPAQIRVLEDYLMDDVWGVMGLYTYSGTRYSVIASRFGAKVVKPRGSTEAFLADEDDVEDGIVYFDPLAKLKGSVRAAEDLTDEQKQRIMRKILPAYMGVLGLRDLDPRLRALMEGLNTYQNLRLLPFLVLSSLPDIAGPAIRAGDANAYMALGEVLGQDKEKLRELAVMIGAIEENVANNILSEEIVNGSHNSVTRRVNDWFFWANQTKRLTDMTRVIAMVVARDFMTKNARDLRTIPNEDQPARARAWQNLKELQITPEQIDAWNRDTRPDAEKVQDPEHIAYITATNRFIDGAVLRPDASVKPGWMSDHRFQLLAYLKSFMFAFHQVMIRRAMENVARADGAKGKAEQVLIATAPLIVLGLLGYELRRLLAGGQVPDRLSMEYLMVGVDKAGLLGPMAILFDGARGRQYGTPTGLNALGPTATQAWGFLDPTWYDVARAVPLVSSSPYIRDALLG